MKLLVTGGAGFIGSAVVRAAIHAGHSVVNVDKLTYAACLDNVKPVADIENYATNDDDDAEEEESVAMSSFFIVRSSSICVLSF